MLHKATNPSQAPWRNHEEWIAWYFLGRTESSASKRSEAYEVASPLQAECPGFGPISHSVMKYKTVEAFIMVGYIQKPTP
jgi:hypothetical protein